MPDRLCEICDVRPAQIYITVIAAAGRRGVAVCDLHHQLLAGSGEQLTPFVRWPNISQQAQEVLDHAGGCARRFGRSEIDSEHLLYVLPESEAAHAVLRRFRLSAEDLRQQIEEDAVKGVVLAEAHEAMTFSSHMKIIVNNSMDSARAFGHGQIQPEYLLLGLAEVPESFAGNLLARYGLTVPALRQQVMRMASSRTERDFPPMPFQNVVMEPQL